MIVRRHDRRDVMIIRDIEGSNGWIDYYIYKLSYGFKNIDNGNNICSLQIGTTHQKYTNMG